ncbi:MAG: hypothetical protein AAF936_17585 [Pseudomonadota bacterium]
MDVQSWRGFNSTYRWEVFETPVTIDLEGGGGSGAILEIRELQHLVTTSKACEKGQYLRHLLTINFNAAANKPASVAITGPDDHAVQMTQGDTLGIEAHCCTPQASQIKILSLSLVATPAGKKSEKQLSPFDHYDACTLIKSWGIPERRLNPDGDLTVINTLSDLSITASTGAWMLYGYLSVLIQKPRKTGRVKLRARLHSFKFKIQMPAYQ